MATKSNNVLTIDREAVSACAEYGTCAARELEPAVAELTAVAKYLCDPEVLSGAEAEEFQAGVSHLSKTINIVQHRIQKLSQALVKISERYGAQAQSTKRSMADAKSQFDAIRAKAQNMTGK